MTDILQLPGWTVSSASSRGEHFIIEAEYTKHPDTCQLCGVIGALYRHGPRPVTFLDSPVRGQPTSILARVQRYKCRECEGTFLQSLEGIDAERRMTKRCLGYIQQQCLRDTFQRVSEHLGCDEKTVRNVAGDYIQTLDAAYEPYLPEWIGLDETHLNKIFRGIITDVRNNRPIDLLPDRDKKTLSRWFGQFRDRKHVKGITIDMWGPYRDIAGQLFENVPVVIDKFHVVKKANESVERTRVRLGKGQKADVRRGWMRSKNLLRMRYRDLNDKQRFNLEMWLDNEPDVATAYRLKERLFDIYDLPKADAIQAYDDFPGSVPSSMKPDFNELTRAMTNWRKEILNYFDHPITNAYTEGVNGVAKVMNRMGRGYSFEVIRARLLFNQRPPSKRQLRAKRAAEADMYRCFGCNGLFNAEELIDDPDHVKAYSTEGTVYENGLILCAACNTRFHHDDDFSHDLVSTDHSG